MIETGGLRFAALEAGEPGRPLVLCLHGFPDSAWTWRHLLPQLGADAAHYAVAPFLRGYAPTELPSAEVSGSRSWPTTCSRSRRRSGRGPGTERRRWTRLGRRGRATRHFEAERRDSGRCTMRPRCRQPAATRSTRSRSAQLRRSWYSFLFQLPDIGGAGAPGAQGRSGTDRLALGRLVTRLRRRRGHPPGEGSAQTRGAPPRGDQLLP